MAVTLFASVTVTVYVVAALTTVGVPETAPVPALKLNPAGSAGVTLYVSGDVPPAPITGVNGVAARFTVSTVEATTVVAVNCRTAVPCRAIVCVVLGLTFRLLSVNTSEPFTVPAAVGAKVTGSVQFVPAATTPAVLLPLPVSGHVPLLVLFN